MRVLIGAAGLALLALGTGCQQDGYDTPRPVKADRVACEEVGGTYTQVGLLQQWACAIPYPDAGKTCTAPSQCAGACLGDDLTGPGKCASTNQTFGCLIFIREDGTREEICID